MNSCSAAQVLRTVVVSPGRLSGGRATNLGQEQEMTSRSRFAKPVIALMLTFAAGAAIAWTSGPSDPFANTPETLSLGAVIRDFRPSGAAGGHPDFESFRGSTTVGLVKDRLDADGKPVAASLRGRTITTEFKDAAGRAINPSLFGLKPGDVAGVLAAGPSTNGLTSADQFVRWYRDVAGVNSSVLVPLTLTRTPGTNQYVFDSAVDEPYKSRGGFFPIDRQLFGDYSSSGHNFHFTTEISATFVFERGKGQVFKFTGDDDVWVFIDNQLVIDLGGLHSKREQFLDLDRLSWLQNGESYSFRIFHAERRTTQSNFRMETTLKLSPLTPPPTSAIYD
jgi:fibro-slime domain-containing protein